MKSEGCMYVPPEYNFVNDIIKLTNIKTVMVIISEQLLYRPYISKGNIIAKTRVHVRATTSQVDVNWKNSMLIEFRPQRNLLF